MSRISETVINEMFESGAHVGYSKSRRHPSVKQFIFESRKTKDIIDLEKTGLQVNTVVEFLKGLSGTDHQILFVGTKPEAKRIVREAAELIDMPFVTERWLGGTLTNAHELKKRISRLVLLSDESEKGELIAATKKERLMLGREIERLERKFGGLRSMKRSPVALFVVDPRKEHIAVEEARQMNVPVIALANTDCDISNIAYPIVANDTSLSSIALFTKKIANALK